LSSGESGKKRDSQTLNSCGSKFAISGPSFNSLYLLAIIENEEVMAERIAYLGDGHGIGTIAKLFAPGLVPGN
jgi:hypothetical protein